AEPSTMVGFPLRLTWKSAAWPLWAPLATDAFHSAQAPSTARRPATNAATMTGAVRNTCSAFMAGAWRSWLCSCWESDQSMLQSLRRDLGQHVADAREVVACVRALLVGRGLKELESGDGLHGCRIRQDCRDRLCGGGVGELRGDGDGARLEPILGRGPSNCERCLQFVTFQNHGEVLGEGEALPGDHPVGA